MMTVAAKELEPLTIDELTDLNFAFGEDDNSVFLIMTKWYLSSA